MKKLDFHFCRKEGSASFAEYINSLEEAHNQMLFLIQNPSNKFPMMEENPIHSQDLLYGVPSAFKDILGDIIEEKAK